MLAIWDNFCRALETNEVRRHLGYLCTDIDSYSIFEFDDEQTNIAEERQLQSDGWEEDHPIPPFPFPKMCIVEKDSISVISEPVLDMLTGDLHFKCIEFLNDSSKVQPKWTITIGTIIVPRDQSGNLQFKFKIHGLRQLNKEPGKNLEENNQDDFQRHQDSYKRCIEMSDEEFEELEQSKGQSFYFSVAKKIRELGKVPDVLNPEMNHIETFQLILQKIAWINHPDHFTVQVGKPKTNPKKKRNKKRIRRLEQRERYITLTKEQIENEWKRVHKGGTHASPIPHLRRGHYKTLRAERYKENRGKRIWIRPTHVNGKVVEWRDGNTYYKVV